LARSGIKTKHGYRKFDSQRVKDVESEEDPVGEEEEYEEELADVGDDEEIEIKPTVKAYNALMQSFQKSEANGERQAKRRKVEATTAAATSYHEVLSDDSSTLGHDEEEEENEEQEEDDEGDDEEAEMDARESSNRDVGGDDEDEEASLEDPFEAHFANPDNNELSMRCQAIQSNEWKAEKQSLDRHTNATVHSPVCVVPSTLRKGVSTVKELPLKERLLRNVEQHFSIGNPLEQSLASYIFNYVDVLFGNRNTRNAASLRNLASLHAVNHILKGRDKVLKNNERIKHAPDGDDLECRDQGFTRPKVLILAETRQMAASYANAIASAFQPEQQENRKRFDDSFTAPLDERETMPEDYRELFGGNNDNSFLTALKFTRKTIKFYSAFYNSDIILASPLGLRRIIENEDVKKRDYDFLSSIEVIIADQADAMQMQNWENVEVVFKHLNLELKESHGCDFNRVRNYYLDGNARYLRQTILFSAYITPEINRLYNTSMLNMAGKAKFTSTYAGAITDTSGLGMKQTFSRFDSGSPMADPEARFKYFTTAILPRLLRLPKPADGAAGILVFIPTYFDFLRLRNYFATSSQTENISFGTIHDYSEVSDQRRARSHFLNGRHSILLYTQRAHHFFRLKIRGVKRVVMYGLPDNPTFYRELIEGYLGTSIAEGKMDPAESSVRSAFSKWDGLRLERIVGTERVKGMLGGVGDTFDFI
jgi:U3 small nucleolar RNA-associated protein 25